MEVIALGALEFSSIAIGMLALDDMIKVAPVKIMEARTLCPGKYLVVFSGELASVEYAFSKGISTGSEFMVDSLLLPMVHPDVVEAVGNIIPNDEWNAVGIIETLTVVSAIEAADSAAKTGGVSIVEVRLAIGFGGKSYVKLLGTLDAVQVAMEAGKAKAVAKGQLCMTTVIPQPHAETKSHFFK